MIPLYLAPMAEFTTPAMRVLCETCGSARTYTEMVNAEGICRESPRSLFLLETFPEERHVWAHLYGHDPVRLAEAARRVEAMGRFEGIDINAGCPVPRITAQGAGSALLRDLPRFGKLMKTVVAAVSLPVSIKTRLGPNPHLATWRETLRMAEDAGVCSVAFHARYTSQGHGGPVDLGTLREAVCATDLPVLGNGSVSDRAGAEAMAATGVQALLIARAALENPGIFGFTACDPFFMTERHLELELRYRRLAASFSHITPEEASVLTFRRHLFRYFKGLPGANRLRSRLMDLRTLDDIRNALRQLKENMAL